MLDQINNIHSGKFLCQATGTTPQKTNTHKIRDNS